MTRRVMIKGQLAVLTTYGVREYHRELTVVEGETIADTLVRGQREVCHTAKGDGGWIPGETYIVVEKSDTSRPTHIIHMRKRVLKFESPKYLRLYVASSAVLAELEAQRAPRARHLPWYRSTNLYVE